LLIKQIRKIAHLFSSFPESNIVSVLVGHKEGVRSVKYLLFAKSAAAKTPVVNGL